MTEVPLAALRIKGQNQHSDKDDHTCGQDIVAYFECEAGSAIACCHDQSPI
jgi:hypothetical protein